MKKIDELNDEEFDALISEGLREYANYSLHLVERIPDNRTDEEREHDLDKLWSNLSKKIDELPPNRPR